MKDVSTNQLIVELQRRVGMHDEGYKKAVENLREARTQVRETLGAKWGETTRDAAKRVVEERDTLKAFLAKIEARVGAAVKAELVERQRGGAR